MNRTTFHLALLLSAVCAAPAAAQSFGRTVALAGEEVLFGQPDIDRTPGAVFVYRRRGGSWEEAARLTADDGIPGDRFGSALAVDGERLLVGAYWADSGRGAAYVFDRGGDGEWRQSARLEAGAVGDSLGLRVALQGDIALLAAAGDSAGGEVRVFRRDQGGGWREAGRLEAPGIRRGDRFGSALAFVDGAAVVGASGQDSAAGGVWIFPAGDQAFGEPAFVSGFMPGAGFGAALAPFGDKLLVGAPGTAMGVGVVVVLGRDDAGEWIRERVLFPYEGRPPLQFGTTIAPAEDEVWIGAPGAERFRGAVYRATYDPATAEWTAMTRLEAPALERGDQFASVLAVGPRVAAAGLPGDDYAAGTGAILERGAGGWEVAARVASEIAPLEVVVGGEVACNGGTAGRFSCGNVDLLAFLPVQAIGGARGVEVNDIWGWTDPETGREYALVGRYDGTAFVDVSDPSTPVYVGQLPKPETSPGSTWRDIKVYQDHAYIVADNAGEHGVQVFDLTRLRSLENPPVTFTEDAHYDGIHSAHNIVINTETGYAYTVGNSDGGETCGGGLHMIDIREPENPTFAGCFSDPATGRQKTGYTHDAQCVVYRGPDEDYQGREICFGSNETALSIADVTDKRSPVAVAVAEYPNVGYTHQAWLTEDHRYLLMDDEMDELHGLVDHTRTLIWDVSDLDDPVVAEEFLNPNTISIDHNQYVVGDKVYQSNYVAGLRVLDISDVENPREVGFFDTMPYASDGPRFDGSWSNYPFFESGVIVVTSGDEGLFLLRYRSEDDRPIS
ncbi:MAG TPA: choice-of-anchor B family protein [Gemmatimonadota bacterium]|nr:choice-of-anchor B family protein [Gemmatimonadota bacterium]